MYGSTPPPPRNIGHISILFIFISTWQFRWDVVIQLQLVDACNVIFLIKEGMLTLVWTIKAGAICIKF